MRRLILAVVVLLALGLWVVNARQNQASVASDRQTVVAQLTTVAGPTLATSDSGQ